MRTAIIKAAFLAAGLSGATLFAQQPSSGSGGSSGPASGGSSGGQAQPTGTTAPMGGGGSGGATKAKPVPGSLAEQLDIALKHNADIKFAEAKVRETEAELHRTRQQVLGRVAALYNEIQAHKESLKILQDVLKLHEQAFKQGAVPPTVLAGAKSNVAKAQIELAKVEGELQSLVGSQGPGQASSTLGTTGFAFSPDGSKLYSVQADRALRVWDAAGKQVAADYYQGYVIHSRLTSVQQPMADRVRKVLDRSVKISDFPANKELKEALGEFWLTAKIDVPIRFLAPSIETQKVQVMTGELPAGAWLQMFEDSVPDLRFVVREYGILVTTKDRVPQGAMTVQDFWSREKAIPAGPTQPATGKTTPPPIQGTTGVKETIKP